ncbi:transglutaminase domain-containing protein [Ulvibacterium marinum]|uniref:transglutaminase domain-containing protein n=1 Tax=Ulvibacterium marinum TaxID=2419782 RepID=UPI00249536A6|nr:transglutaminase domain-containing protein [Ulvibacterium marinum]
MSILLLLIGFISSAQSDFTEIDSQVKSIGFSPKNELARNITLGFETDLEKIRALYIWVTENISYDFELLESEELKSEFYISEENVIDKTLERKKAICSGYSLLFKKLCTDLNIECETVSGFSKQWLDSFLSKRVSDHAWNVVKIDGKWHFIDTTWASKNEFSEERDDFWYLTKPEFFIYSHYPEYEKWTLLDYNISKEEFDQLPVITDRTFFEDNIIVIYPKNTTIEVSKNRVIKLELQTKNTNRSISLLGYPWETYASQNNLEFPSDDEYSKLSAEEAAKYNQVIPSLEIIKQEVVDNKIRIEAKVKSENLEKFEIYVEGNAIAKFNVIME